VDPSAFSQETPGGCSTDHERGHLGERLRNDTASTNGIPGRQRERPSRRCCSARGWWAPARSPWSWRWSLPWLPRCSASTSATAIPT